MAWPCSRLKFQLRKPYAIADNSKKTPDDGVLGTGATDPWTWTYSSLVI